MPTYTLTLLYDGHAVTCDDCASIRYPYFCAGRGQPALIAAFCLELRAIVPSGFGCTRFTPDAVDAHPLPADASRQLHDWETDGGAAEPG
jgi:hypothetical protein